jgi:hypothetical protein
VIVLQAASNAPTSVREGGGFGAGMGTNVSEISPAETAPEASLHGEPCGITRPTEFGSARAEPSAWCNSSSVAPSLAPSTQVPLTSAQPPPPLGPSGAAQVCGSEPAAAAAAVHGCSHSRWVLSREDRCWLQV